MHRIDQHLYLIRVYIRCDAMTQVENMSAARAKTFNDLPSLFADHIG